MELFLFSPSYFSVACTLALRFLKHLENREQLRGFVDHLSRKSVFLYNLCLFLPARELVSFTVWVCQVIVLSLMDFAFEIVSSICTASIVTSVHRVSKIGAFNRKVLCVIHFIKILWVGFFTLWGFFSINQFMNYSFALPPNCIILLISIQ